MKVEGTYYKEEQDQRERKGQEEGNTTKVCNIYVWSRYNEIIIVHS